MAPKTSFIIVPGSFATAAIYDSLVAELKKQGHAARAIDLPSANDGSRLPAPTGEDDSEHIRAEILADLDDNEAGPPSDVVVMLHSYAGVPGSSALKGLGRADRAADGKTTAVVGVMYLSSFVLPLGESNRSWLSARDAMPEPYKSGVPGGYLPAIDPSFGAFIFNDIKQEEERARYLAMMTRHSSDSFNGVVSYEAWKHIPSVLVIPEHDFIVPTPLLEAMYEQSVAAGGKVKRVFVEGAGHCFNVSRPEIVAEELVKLAAGGE
jgi:pimeloyl-ACP methyl ester carboxylesterase